MYKFRGVAYHAPPAAGDLDGYVSRLRLSEVEAFVRELSKRREVWTVRVVSTPLEDAVRALGVSAEKYVEEFYEAARRVSGYVAFPLTKPRAELIVDLAASFDRAYFSVPYAEDWEGEIISVLRQLPEKAGWVSASRFAVSFGERPVTAYFPVTTSEGEGLTLSLLYPSHAARLLDEGLTLADAMRETALEAYRLAYEALDSSGSKLALHGIDLSLSPWDTDSVALLLEKLLDAPLFTPGTFQLLHAVNEALTILASSLHAPGFNEVMLPLAEDARLKELSSVGHLRFRDLLAVTPACVAGLDMVPIPSSTEDRVLKWVMRDLRAAQKLKKRPLGMRLLLVDAEPGEEVDLGMFGKTPVLDPLS
ncbi:MAG: DUF711 family protein [Thermofilaceae archaeon]